ncbi:MAG: hypothetical protein AAF732_21720 [Pseudomonadota bacterium]
MRETRNGQRRLNAQASIVGLGLSTRLAVAAAISAAVWVMVLGAMRG